MSGRILCPVSFALMVLASPGIYASAESTPGSLLNRHSTSVDDAVWNAIAPLAGQYYSFHEGVFWLAWSETGQAMVVTEGATNPMYITKVSSVRISPNPATGRIEGQNTNSGSGVTTRSYLTDTGDLVVEKFADGWEGERAVFTRTFAGITRRIFARSAGGWNLRGTFDLTRVSRTQVTELMAAGGVAGTEMAARFAAEDAAVFARHRAQDAADWGAVEAQLGDSLAAQRREAQTTAAQATTPPGSACTTDANGTRSAACYDYLFRDANGNPIPAVAHTGGASSSTSRQSANSGSAGSGRSPGGSRAATAASPGAIEGSLPARRTPPTVERHGWCHVWVPNPQNTNLSTIYESAYGSISDYVVRTGVSLRHGNRRWQDVMAEEFNAVVQSQYGVSKAGQCYSMATQQELAAFRNRVYEGQGADSRLVSFTPH